MNTDCNNKDRLPSNGIPFTDEEPDEEGVSVYEHHRLTADSGQKPMRIDKFLMEHLYNTSRNRLQRAAEQEFILVNGRPVKSSYKVKPLDEIVILLDRPKYDNEIIAEDIPLDIVYEDEDLMVVDKPAGLVVHPGCGNYTGTLVNAIAWHLKDNPDYDPNDPTVGLVHRIDKDTSGLLVVAKKRRFQKRIWANSSSTKPPKDCTMLWSGEAFRRKKDVSKATSPATRKTGCRWQSSRRTAKSGNMPSPTTAYWKISIMSRSWNAGWKPDVPIKSEPT